MNVRHESCTITHNVQHRTARTGTCMLSFAHLHLPWNLLNFRSQVCCNAVLVSEEEVECVVLLRLVVIACHVLTQKAERSVVFETKTKRHQRNQMRGRDKSNCRTTIVQKRTRARDHCIARTRTKSEMEQTRTVRKKGAGALMCKCAMRDRSRVCRLCSPGLSFPLRLRI